MQGTDNAPDAVAPAHGVSGGAAAASAIVRLDMIGTGLFTATAMLAAAVFSGPLKVLAVVVALALFAIGVFGFLSSYWTAVQRSRTETIAVAQLYFLVSGSTPRPIRRLMNGLLSVQVLVAFGTALARSSTNGRPGSTLAFGILVPMFGLGLNGLWCARNGAFAARTATVKVARSGEAHDHDIDDDIVDDPGSDIDDAEFDTESDSDGRSDEEFVTNAATVPTSDDEMEQNSRHG